MSLFGKQILSYIITFVVYAGLIGWQAGLVLMIGIGFHEYGHLWAAKKMGFESKGFFLFPFVGGLALSSGQTKKYSHQAFVVIMGPVWGGALAAATYLLYTVTGSPILGQAALWMAWVNLFNLAPLAFMDGGQLLESITYSINETLGFYVMTISSIIAVPILWKLSPILAILVVVFGWSGTYASYQNWKQRKELRKVMSEEEVNQVIYRPKKMNAKELTLTIGSYVGTALLLGLLTVSIQTHNINMMDMIKR